MVRRLFFAALVILPAAIGAAAYYNPLALWAFAAVGPVLLLGLHDVVQHEHSLLRNYPIIGHGRYLMEEIRPEIQQYFVESNTDGMPFSREFRSVIYQRAKGVRDTLPFGTQRDLRSVGTEWMNQSLAPKVAPHEEERIKVGGPQCDKPYSASHLNISAMSFGSLSRNAILALNGGAKRGGFAHNTGEGGLSPYHLEPGGDITWQIGTGYFGCRTTEGGFDADRFADNAKRKVVKMIEIKLSQGAKPGHGGILPAAKVTPEIAAIRGVPLGKDVLSPPAHSTFSTPRGLLEFVVRLRELSGGKPVGFKLCVGHRSELIAIAKAMHETGILPDFITVDGAEGGTGAAPVELSNSAGMPFRFGLRIVHNALIGIGVRSEVRIIGSAKITTGFHIFRAMALGADMCNSARAMMFAIGCIQARRCNDNSCPVGVATQDPSRYVGLHVEDKTQRVARFHQHTIESFQELVAAAGLDSARQIRPNHVMKMVGSTTVKLFSEVYPTLALRSLLEGTAPEDWLRDWHAASVDRF